MTFASSNDDMMSAFILLFLLLVCVTRNQNIYLNCSTNEKIPLHLVGFFPCLDRWSSREPVGNCDKLPLTAVEYVISLINQDTNLLKCFRLELFPITIQNPQQNSTELFEILYNEYDDQPIHGVIGPYHADTAKLFAYIFGRYLPTVQISYSVTSILLEDSIRYPYFHSTAPNDVYLSRVVIELMEHFSWQKVAILSTQDESSVSVSQILAKKLFSNNNNLARLFDSFANSAVDVLNDAKAEDFRIFVAIIDFVQARQLLCQAYRLNLTSPQHVWILQGIHNPNWWQLDDLGNTTSHDCTNSEMKEAITSALFIGMQSGAFPLINEVKDTVILNILNTNGELTDAEFHHVLHSKMLGAYDAAMSLALAWNVTLHNFTTEELGTFLNQSWKASGEGKQMLAEAMQSNMINVVSPYTGLAGTYDYNRSQSKLESALITQFTGGQECIIGYFSASNSLLQKCHTEHCCNVTWKGNYQPSDGQSCPTGSCTCRHPIDSSILLSFFISALVLSAGIIVSVLLQFVNYRWRNNKFFKSSSPVLNAFITLGCTMGYSVGLLVMGNYYIGITGKGDIIPICNTAISVTWLSMAFVNSTILMKNWRIFRIFHNPTQRKRKNLSNAKLYLGMGLLCVPVIAALIIMVVLGVFNKYEVLITDYHCPGYPDSINTSLVEDHCVEAMGFTWDALIALYIFFLFVSIITLGSFNCRIHSHYKKEGELAILTGTISILMFAFYYALGLILTSGYTKSGAIKNQIVYGTAIPLVYYSFILAILYGSKAIQIIKDKKVRPKLVRRKSTIRKKYNDLHDELFVLKHQLGKIDEDLSAVYSNSTRSSVSSMQ